MPAKSKTPAIDPAKYQKIVALGSRKGSVDNIPTILGTENSATVQLYLDHMKATHAALYKTWGSKWKPEGVLDDEEDDDDMFSAPPPKKAKTAKGSTAGLEALFTADEDTDVEVETEEEEKPAPPSAPKKVKFVPEATEEVKDLFPEPQVALNDGKIRLDGQTYPQKFRLQKPDGTTADLELFSKGPKFGFIFRHLVPKDLRTITVAGRQVTVDLLALQADPDGMTEVWEGKSLANSKLITLVEIEADI